jgi:hypothetical protein
MRGQLFQDYKPRNKIFSSNNRDGSVDVRLYRKDGIGRVRVSAKKRRNCHKKRFLLFKLTHKDSNLK